MPEAKFHLELEEDCINVLQQWGSTRIDRLGIGVDTELGRVLIEVWDEPKFTVLDDPPKSIYMPLWMFRAAAGHILEVTRDA